MPSSLEPLPLPVTPLMVATMEPDWSQLPRELLELISKKLNTELYLLRFRSVCSTWRRYSIPNYRHNNNNHSFLKQIPHFPNSVRQAHGVWCLSKQNIFLIKPPTTLTPQQTPIRPWLIRIGPELDGKGKTHLWHPFDHFQEHPFNFTTASYFPDNLIDFNQLSVRHLGQIFYIHNTWQHHYEKVVVAMSEVGQPLALLTYDFSEVLKIFRCGDNSWMSIPTMSSSWKGDICIFKGSLCVADNDGRTLMIGPDSTVHLLANPVYSGGLFKFVVVESECESLFLVGCHGMYTAPADDLVRFDVFRLDEKNKRWVKVMNIGDHVLFLGEFCSFSASALELGIANGNCVIYSRKFSYRNFDDLESSMHVFHLDQCRVSKLSDYPDYIKLFWPPPEWILKLH